MSDNNFHTFPENEVAVYFKLLNSKTTIPEYQTDGSAGMDLCAGTHDDIVIGAHETVIVPTGLAIEIPKGYEGQIRSRSGLASRGLVVANSPGTIDSDYRGELGVILHNQCSISQVITANQRIAQLVIAPVVQVDIRVTKQLSETIRGDKGFGSTGK